jgi:type I restriction enzyme S subunit
MANEWRTEQLSELYEFSSGLSKPRSEFGFGHGFLTFKDVLDNHFVPIELSALVNSTEKDQATCSIQRGDVFLTRTSETQPDLGMSCVALRDYPKATFNGFTKRLRPKSSAGVVPEYAGYYFRSPRFRREVTSMSSLSTRASLNNEMLSRLSIVVPPVNTQKAIGSILKAFDDKIDINRRMNATLEAITRAVFQAWFVDFEPIRAKAEGRQLKGVDDPTAALFSDTLENTTVGPIPSNWRIGQIRDLTESIQYGFTQSASDTAVGPHFLRITDIQGGKVSWAAVPYCSISPEDHARYKIEPGDIFVARTGASTGENIYVVDCPDSVFASYLVRFRFEDSGMARVVGAFMRTPAYFDYVAGVRGGSAQPNASAQVLASATMVVPPAQLAARFAQIIMPLDKKRYANDCESKSLVSLRDALLPKLMSGEVRV